ETVTPAWLWFPPIVTTTGWSPEGTFGIVTFNCMTPDTKSGASPAKLQFAGCPPISTDTSSSGAGVSGPGGAATLVTLPVTPAGEVCPSPVRYSTTVSPRLAGLPEELVVPFWFRMAPGPVPEEFSVNNPGAVVATFTGIPFEVWPRNFTSTFALAKPAT